MTDDERQEIYDEFKKASSGPLISLPLPDTISPWDFFAGCALVGLAQDFDRPMSGVPETAFRAADAMIAERERRLCQAATTAETACAPTKPLNTAASSYAPNATTDK